MKTSIWPSTDRLSGKELIGRQIWLRASSSKSGNFMVFDYKRSSDIYTLVSVHNGKTRQVRLRSRAQDWALLPKRSSSPENPVLEGTIIEFLWPQDRLAYHAMVYRHSRNGNKLNVLFYEVNRKEVLEGIPWTVVNPSPCRSD